MTKRGELWSGIFVMAVTSASVGSCAVMRALPLGVGSHAAGWFCPILGVLSVGVALVGLNLLRRRQWELGLGSLACAAITIVFSFFVRVIGDIDAAFADEDHFADDLVVPAGLSVREPVTPWSPPPDSAGAANSSLTLHEIYGRQPGNYKVSASVNPTETGTVYLRAFEVTRGAPLSVRSIRAASTRDIVESNDPNELFRYEAELTVAEGNWGQHYAARFELWFTPADGGPERMLLSDVFRIEGWMR